MKTYMAPESAFLAISSEDVIRTSVTMKIQNEPDEIMNIGWSKFGL